MRRESLKRVRQLAPGGSFAHLAGGLTVILALLQVVTLALTVALCGADDAQRVAIGGLAFRWPVPGRFELNLVVLILAALWLTLMTALTATWFRRRAFAAAAQQVMRVQSDVYQQAERQGLIDLLGQRHERPEQIALNDADLIREGLMARQWSAYALVLHAGLVGLSLVASPWLTVLAVVDGVLLFRMLRWIAVRNRAAVAAAADAQGIERRALAESLRLLPLATAYLLPGLPGEDVDANIQRCALAARRLDRVRWAPTLWSYVVLSVGGLFFALIAGLSRQLNPAGAVLMLAAAAGTFLLLKFFAAGELLDRAEEAAGNLFRFLDREPAVSEMAAAQALPRMHQRVEFQQVTLADRSGNRLFDGVDLEIPAGKFVSVIGSDEQSVRAFLGLLVRFVDPAAGKVLLDGREVRRGQLRSLRGQVAMVTRELSLFTASVADNISCGEGSYTPGDVVDAARLTCADELIGRLPQGYETIVGANGFRLEAGEAFRVALARAVLRDPALLVIEEPAGISPQEAHLIDMAFERLRQDRTVVVVPSRQATLRTSDRVYLLHEGKLEGVGTHAELLQSSELYRHLVYLRFHPALPIGQPPNGQPVG